MLLSSGPFYRTPLTASFGFGKHAVGVNTLEAMFSAATKRKIVNHSGRIICCTCLYNSGFDNKARSGHRSEAVHGYERLSNRKCLSVKR